MTGVQLQQLPADVLQRVVKLLGSDDRRKLKCLCRSLRSTVDATWTSLTIHLDGKEILHSLHRCVNLQRVDLLGSWADQAAVKHRLRGLGLDSLPAEATRRGVELVLRLEPESPPYRHVSLRWLGAVLAAGDALGPCSRVRVLGWCLLDSDLGGRLVAATAVAPLPPGFPAAGQFASLVSLSVHLFQPEYPALLSQLRADALPGLRRLSLTAPSYSLGNMSGLGVRDCGELARLDLPRLDELALVNVHLQAGLACVTHLAGLSRLCLSYPGDLFHCVSVNQAGDVECLAALPRLASLELENVDATRGLSRLQGLTQLALATKSGAFGGRRLCDPLISCELKELSRLEELSVVMFPREPVGWATLLAALCTLQTLRRVTVRNLAVSRCWDSFLMSIVWPLVVSLPLLQRALLVDVITGQPTKDSHAERFSTGTGAVYELWWENHPLKVGLDLCQDGHADGKLVRRIDIVFGRFGRHGFDYLELPFGR